MPCHKVYSIKSNHSPFFSKPWELVNILNEIASDNDLPQSINKNDIWTTKGKKVVCPFRDTYSINYLGD